MTIFSHQHYARLSDHAARLLIHLVHMRNEQQRPCIVVTGRTFDAYPIGQNTYYAARRELIDRGWLTHMGARSYRINDDPERELADRATYNERIDRQVAEYMTV